MCSGEEAVLSGEKSADAREEGASARRTEAQQPLGNEERLLQRALRGAP